MNQEQLANVLVKILGLSLAIHSVAGVISGIFAWLQMIFDGAAVHSTQWRALMMYPVSSLVVFGLGIFMIMRSRWVVEKMFNQADE